MPRVATVGESLCCPRKASAVSVYVSVGHTDLILNIDDRAEHYSANPVMIFSGVVACCADVCPLLFLASFHNVQCLPLQLSPADEEALSGTILALGGQYRAGLTRDVTHLFALSEKSDRYQTAVYYQSETHVSVVTPHWFDDCVLLCRRLDTSPYSWPDPQVLKPKSLSAEKDHAALLKERVAATPVPEEKRTLFRTAAQEGKVENAHGNGVLPQYEGGDVWKGRKLLLSRSLGLSADIKGAVEAGIWRAGGTVLSYSEKNGEGTEEEELNLLESADVFVTRYRHGSPYIKVSILG
jgi:mediator of DNA damage checkpoint protein 1